MLPSCRRVVTFLAIAALCLCFMGILYDLGQLTATLVSERSPSYDLQEESLTSGGVRTSSSAVYGRDKQVEPQHVDTPASGDTLEADIARLTSRLEEVRRGFLSAAGSAVHVEKLASVIRENDRDFLVQVAHRPWMKNLVLYPSVLHGSTGPVVAMGDNNAVRWRRKPLYQIYADRGMCKSVEKGVNGFNATLCAEHTNLSTSAVPMKEGGIYDRHFRDYSAISILAIPNARISAEWKLHGNIWTRDTVLMPAACDLPYNLSLLVEANAKNSHDEVFVISQIYGLTHYHFNANNFPRIMPFIRFLRANPSIKVHVIKKSEPRMRTNMKMIGLDPGRLIDGTVNARVAYMPRGGGCFKSMSPLNLQLLSNAYVSYMDEHYPPIPRKAVVLIQRTQSRQLSCHDAIADYLRTTADKLRLDFVIYSDAHQLPLNDTLQLFRRAALVVAPHGAGLVNVLWTRPPAVVVEVNCKSGRPVQCFAFLSRNLGHRHFSLQADQGCMGGLNIEAGRLIKVIEAAARFVQS